MDLKVQIPKRYKNTLSKRFNSKYAELNDGVCYITINCPLCSVYTCKNCPFGKFGENKIGDGCMIWICKVYGRKKGYWSLYENGITFDEICKAKAIKSLNWFRDRAEELIEWI